MEDGATQDYVEASISKRHPLDRFDAKVVRRQMRRQLSGQLPSLGNRGARFVDRKNLHATPEQIDEITPRATAGIQHPHPRNDSPLQQLIEQVNVDGAKPLLKI